jgi:hypothetical protein
MIVFFFDEIIAQIKRTKYGRSSVAVHTGKHYCNGPEGNAAASQGPAFFLATV